MYFADEREIEAIRRVFARKKLFRYQLSGPTECDLFEKEFSAKIGSAHAILLTSGTNALVAALAASGIGPGDEVIVPAYTFVATAAAVVQVGAIPVIANVDETLGISLADVQARLTARTKAVIPVHMDGLSCDMRGIADFCRDRSLVLIEDVAQAIGGSFRGRALGTWGEFGCFSLNENKHISCGEGGIVVTSRRDLFEKAFCIHDTSAQFNPVHKDTFQHIRPFLGLSMRVSEISGAMMRVQLERLDDILSGLRERKRVLSERARSLRGIQVITGSCAEGDCASSFHLLFEDPERAQRAGATLRKEGILFAPVTARPAHAAWKWAPLLGERASYSEKRNPYRQTEERYSYSTAELLQSVSILTRVLRMETDLHASIEQTKRLADRIAVILREL